MFLAAVLTSLAYFCACTKMYSVAIEVRPKFKSF